MLDVHNGSLDRLHSSENIESCHVDGETPPQVKYLQCGLSWPSASVSVSTSPALNCTPCSRSRLAFSLFIQVPRTKVTTMQVPDAHAVATRVGTYFGAYSTLNVPADRIPARLLRPTKIPVVAAREFSERLLLLCQECTRHEGT